jgi:hypothetical protein
MLRQERSDIPSPIPDRELGVAALLLLVAIVLTVAMLPALF